MFARAREGAEGIAGIDEKSNVRYTPLMFDFSEALQ
jgi:hypothetical protein